VREPDIQAMLLAHHYVSIQLDAASLAPHKAVRFTAPILRTLLAQYRPVLVNQSYAIFVPGSRQLPQGPRQ